MEYELSTDLLTGLVKKAFSDARFAAEALNRVVIPAWPPHRRTFPAHLARRLSGEDIFSVDLMRDLETFLEALETRISDETEIVWQGDEHDTRGGAEHRVMNQKTRVLAQSAGFLRSAQISIQDALDAARAIRVARDLLDT